MTLLAVIGFGFQIALLLLQKWLSWNGEQKQKVKDILDDVDIKDPSSVSLAFGRIHRL